MKQVAKFPGLLKRGNNYSLRIHIPEALRSAYQGRKEILLALGTTDQVQAVNLATQKRAEYEAKFAKLRSVSASTPSASPQFAPLTSQECMVLARSHHLKCLHDNPIKRRKLLKQARKDPEAFWRGEIIPEPEDGHLHQAVPYSFWRDVCLSGEIDFRDAFQYALHAMQKDQLKDLESGYAVGDCDAFLAMASTLRPEASEEDNERLALELMSAEIRALRTIIAGDLARFDEIAASVSPEPTKAGPVQNRLAPKLSEICDQWLRAKETKLLRAKTVDACREAVALFIELVGDHPISQYDKGAMREFKDILSGLPANRRVIRATRNLDARAAVNEAARLQLKLISPKTVNERLSTLHNLFKWVRNNYDGVPANPFDGANIEVKTNKRDEKHPFTNNDLTAIFNAPIYKGCKSNTDWQQSGTYLPRERAIYWLPILGLYTGARSNELCKLKVADIAVDQGIWYLDINEKPFSDTKISPRLKSPDHARCVPIHPDLISYGFLDFVETQRFKVHERLFPELKPAGKDGKLQGAFSKHFARFLKSVRVKRPKVDFHSFRHTFVDECSNARVPDEIIQRLKGDVRPGTLARYGSGRTPLDFLSEEINKLKINVDLSHLRVVGSPRPQVGKGTAPLPPQQDNEIIE